MFDKAKVTGDAKECENRWYVEEHEPRGTMNKLEIVSEGHFLGFNHELVKGVNDRISSKLENKNCDGIAFLNDT